MVLQMVLLKLLLQMVLRSLKSLKLNRPFTSNGGQLIQLLKIHQRSRNPGGLEEVRSQDGHMIMEKVAGVAKPILANCLPRRLILQVIQDGKNSELQQVEGMMNVK